jgi:hydroxyquinol 1,2-dioxygenase
MRCESAADAGHVLTLEAAHRQLQCRWHAQFILLSDTLGVSVLVITLNHPADRGSVESTVQGPFYWEGAPELPCGSNLTEGVEGEPAFYSGRVLSESGRPLENALLDIWSGNGEGNYDMQIPGRRE